MLSPCEVKEFKKEAEALRARFNNLRTLPEEMALENLNVLAEVCRKLDAVLWELAKAVNDDVEEDPNG